MKYRLSTPTWMVVCLLTLCWCMFPISTWAQAVAVDCSAGQAPVAYASSDCNFQCANSGGHLIQCWDSALAVAVEDYAQSGDRTYSIWGVDDSSNKYCCFVDDPNHDITGIEVWGTSNDDDLRLSHAGRSVVHAQTHVSGWAGADYILGSDSPSTTDHLFGGDGNDEIEGQDGNDILEGGAGDDHIEGDSGNDWIRGQDGNDTLWGGAGADAVCGGATDGSGSDELSGMMPQVSELPNAVDLLWAPGNANTPTGYGQSGDQCGDAGTHTGWAGDCSDVLTTRPTGCFAAGPPP